MKAKESPQQVFGKEMSGTGVFIPSSLPMRALQAGCVPYLNMTASAKSPIHTLSCGISLTYPSPLYRLKVARVT